MHAGAQSAGAFAMDDTDAEDTTLPAFTEVVLQQVADLTRLEGVEVEFVRDLDLHRFR
jgi:hypothetical protein